MNATINLDQVARSVRDEFLCDCETCARTAAVCPASASSLILEVARLRAAMQLITTPATVRHVLERNAR